MKVVDAKSLKQWLHDGKEIALLDVREAGQFGERHLFFAIPSPYSRLEADIERLVPRQSTRIVLVDDAPCTIARLAYQQLVGMGYIDVHILDHGMKGWQDAGLEIFAGVNVPSKTFGELAEHAFHTPRITAKELNAKIQNQEDLVVLDGRPFAEYQKMNIPGAQCCPNGELALRIDDIVSDPKTTIVINCAGRTRSIIGAQTLINLGIPNPVYALENGTQGWYLEDFKLEHGSSRKYPALPTGTDLGQRQNRAQQLAQKHRINTVDFHTVQAWRNDPSRTTYLCDVRTAEERVQQPIPAAQHTPGGQLIQATDQYVATRGARLVLIDTENVRAPAVATWMSMLGWEVAVFDIKDIDKLSNLQAAGKPTYLPAEVNIVKAKDLQSHMDTGAHLVDLRPSMQYRSKHIRGATWSIRPSLLAHIQSLAQRPQHIVLLAADQAIAALVAKDLLAAGFTNLSVCLDDPNTWIEAGLMVESTPDTPPNEACIDYLFFVHDRHDGNKASARQYLAWETNLLSQIDELEKNTFRLP